MVDMLKFKDGSNIWFTSDHHFNDDRIRQFCSRPFGTVAEMDQVMTDNWNRVVGKFLPGRLGNMDAGQRMSERPHLSLYG